MHYNTAYKMAQRNDGKQVAVLKILNTLHIFWWQIVGVEPLRCKLIVPWQRPGQLNHIGGLYTVIKEKQ